jgi:diguanylate cyclase (GGDEF)-like protein/PAS domain S-box-containing protein
MEEHKYTSRAQLIAALESSRKQIDKLKLVEQEQHRALQSLRESEEKYRILLDQSSDPIFSFGPSGRYRYVNQAFAEGVGLEIEQIIGKTVWHLFSKKEADRRFRMVRSVFEFKEAKVEEERVPTPEGDLFFLTTAKPIFDDNGNVILAICISKDITERKQLEDDLQKFSTHDQLTGIFNRYHLEAELQRFQGGRSFPFGIVVVDMDNLKYVNDKFGHSAGDIFLRTIARVLQDTFRKEDIIARSGGDEFVILLPNTTVSEVRRIVARLRNKMDEQENVLLSISVGYSVGDKGCYLPDVLKNADDQMYQDKQSKK